MGFSRYLKLILCVEENMVVFLNNFQGLTFLFSVRPLAHHSYQGEPSVINFVGRLNGNIVYVN